jgi:hypothetical protein
MIGDGDETKLAIFALAILMPSITAAAAAKDWQCGRDLVVIDVGDESGIGIIYRNGDPKRAEDLIMGHSPAHVEPFLGSPTGGADMASRQSQSVC